MKLVLKFAISWPNHSRQKYHVSAQKAAEEELVCTGIKTKTTHRGVQRGDLREAFLTPFSPNFGATNKILSATHEAAKLYEYINF